MEPKTLYGPQTRSSPLSPPLLMSMRRGAMKTAVPAIEVQFDDPDVLGALFGQFDANLVLIENRLGVFIAARGNRVQIEGRRDSVARARDVLKGMHQRLDFRDQET